MKTRKFIEIVHSAISGLLRFLIGIFVILGLLLSIGLVSMSLAGYFDFNEFLTYRGYFSTWTIFEPPPSAIEKIIRADGNKVIWIETKEGEIYSRHFHLFGSEKNLPWKKEKEADFLHTHIYSEHLSSCEFGNSYKFEKSFLNPPEKIVQCARFEEWYAHSIYIWYFVLSENGTLWMYRYWESEIFAFSILCFLVIGISILLLAVLHFGIAKLKLRLERVV